MRTLFTLLLITILGVGSVFGECGPRSINWVHGFLGNKDSWKAFDEYFSADCPNLETARIEYPSMNGIDECAELSIPQLNLNNNPMVIAHSMGGLVTRAMIQQGAPISCYVTFGTPHEGAYFANSYLNGDVEAFMLDFTEEVFVDVLGALTMPHIPLVNDNLHNLFGTTDPQLICDRVFTFVEKYMKEQTDDLTISNIKLEGEYIQNLPEPDVPKIMFFGAEESPVHWRFLASYADASQNDGHLKDKFENLQALYETVYSTSLALSVTCFSWPFVVLPGCVAIGTYAANLAYQMDQAITSLERSEAAWLMLIGAASEAYEHCFTESLLVGYDYNRNGIYDEEDRRIRDSCQWKKITVISPDSIHIDLDIECESVLDEEEETNQESENRRPDPCHDFAELYEDVIRCYTVYRQDVSDGFIVKHTTKEQDCLAWVEINSHNHQELKSSLLAQKSLENLFKGDKQFDDSKFAIFKLY